MMRSRLLRLSLSVSTLALPGALHAQAAGPAAGAPQAAPQGLQDIIVTANRRSENQQLVPTTITALPNTALTAKGIITISDMPKGVPGLQVNRQGVASNFYLRGIGTSSSGFNVEPPVAVYLDGLYIPNPGSSAFSFNNIERIEVLKGPQGTLYGRNTTGGLIGIITRDPGRETHVDASIGYANYDTITAKFYGSMPLSETVAMNVSASYNNQHDGWGHNVVDGSPLFTDNEKGVQSKLRWTPSSATTVQLQGTYSYVKTDQGNVEAIFPGSIGVDGRPALDHFLAGDRRAPFATSKFFDVALKIRQDIGFADLSSTTGYIDSRGIFLLNRNGIPGSFTAGQPGTVWSDVSGHSRTFSQEVQVASHKSAASRFDWIAGVYYYHDDTFSRNDVYTPCSGTTAASCQSLPGGAAPSRTDATPTTRSIAAFGEGTYKITPTTRLTFGLRYTHDSKGIGGLISYLQGRPNSITVGPPGLPQPVQPGLPTATLPAIPLKSDYSKVTYKAVLAQDLGQDVHSYFSYSTGFKSGIYNTTAFSNPPAAPEEVTSYELGLKSELFDRRLRLNLALFHTLYKNIQLRTAAPPAPPGATIIYNASSARINGVDADFEFVPARGLTINGGLEYIDSKFGTLVSQCSVPAPAGGNRTILPCDNSGHRLPFAPRLTYTLGATYTAQTGIGALQFNLNDSYQSKEYWDPSNRLFQDPYHLLSSSITWTSTNKTFDVRLFVRNLTNKYYYAQVVETGSDLYSPGAPRTYGITVGFHY